MTPTIASLATFLAVICIVISLASLISDLLLKKRSPLNRRMDEEFHRNQRERAKRSSLFKDLHKLAAQPFDETRKESLTRRERLERMLEQAGLDWTPTRLLEATFAAAGGVGLAAGLLGGNFLVATLATVAGGVAPLIYVRVKRSRRLEALRKQLPDAYELMSRALRAGQTISQAMQGVADEFAQPIADEFSYCYEQQNLGLPSEVALRDLSRRTGLIEVNIFVVAVVVQRQVGGNLAEMLEGLARVVRERYRIRGAIRTLTAEGRLQAAVLMAMPPAMFLAMLTLNRPYALVLLDYPWLLVGILVSMGIGALWIRRIINFDF